MVEDSVEVHLVRVAVPQNLALTVVFVLLAAAAAVVAAAADVAAIRH